MIERVRISIAGKVQGVYYRKSTQEKAMELGLAGFVQNESDGSVTCEAEGHPEAVSALITWCRQGPPMSTVDRVLHVPVKTRGEEGFEIRR